MDKGQEIFSKLVQKTHDVKLSEREKNTLFSTVDAFVKKNPILATEAAEDVNTQTNPIQSPFQINNIDRFFTMFQSYGMHGLRPAIALLVVIGVGFAGTSLAAARSLPGDLLYPIMVYVNEPIGGAFLSGDERVQYEIERAQKRVNEVIKLAIENRLSPEVRDQVVAVLDVHVSRVKEEVNVLAGEGEFKSAIEFTNSLEEVLSVDQAVSFVNEVTDINTDDESLKLELAVIDEVIRGPREASVHAREDAEQKFISSNMPAGAESVAKDIADMKRASLEGLLGRIDPIDSTIQMDQLMTAKMAVPAVATLSASPVSEDTKDKKDIESKTVTPRSEVQALFDLGNEQYSLGNYTQAFIYFKQAFDAAAKLEVKSEEKKEILNLDSEKIEDDSVVSENKSDKNVSTDEKQTNTAEVINAVKKGTVKDVVKTKTQ